MPTPTPTRKARTQEKLWKCPTCKRKFAKYNQAHSRGAVSVDTYFAGKTGELRALFDELCAKLKTFGSLRVDAVKSSVNLVARHHFGGVHVLKDGLRAGFIIPRPLKHPRILRMEPITATIFAHRVKSRISKISMLNCLPG